MTSRVALISGCGKADGMGQAIARRLAADGMSVVVTDLDASGVPNAGQVADGAGVHAFADELRGAGFAALSLLGDIADETSASSMVEQAAAWGGRLDVLVNNAAAPQGPDRGDIVSVPI
jgi:3-oxoacyl-[acyl-carrier protein] reductase